MALFGKKKTVNCAICGKEAKTGLLRGLFQKEIGGQYVCGDCYGVVDLPVGMEANMTLDQFRGYMAFRDQNQKLKDVFQATVQVDFGTFEDKIVFDMNNRLMCMNKNLSTTVFEAKHIKSFTIKEDERTIFSGGPNGLTAYGSNVREQIRALEPRIRMFQMRKRQYEQELQTKSDEERRNTTAPRFNVVQPFRNFNVEIQLQHPYWQILQADLPAPTLSTQDPDSYDYMNSYNFRFGAMEDMANALMELAFPRAGQQDYDPAPAAPSHHVGVSGAASANVMQELKNYKELLDMGIITQEEFNAKKRQLLNL